MFNVLMDELPTEWEGYQVNTWFQIGIQVYQVYEDDGLSDFEKNDLIIQLLFSNEDGTMREVPKELNDCILWFLNGWNHDHAVQDDDHTRKMDFDVDQWRIYADFRNNYGINLNEADLHWWEFMGMLWNMPPERSSFLQVIDIRTKKPRKEDSAEYKKALERAHRVYDLEQKKSSPKYSKEEEQSIDAYDRMMAEMKRKAIIQKGDKDGV